MTVKQLLDRLGKEPLDAKVLMYSTSGDLHEIRRVAFTWAQQVVPGGRFYKKTAKHTANVVTAVEIVIYDHDHRR